MLTPEPVTRTQKLTTWKGRLPASRADARGIAGTVWQPAERLDQAEQNPHDQVSEQHVEQQLLIRPPSSLRTTTKSAFEAPSSS